MWARSAVWSSIAPVAALSLALAGPAHALTTLVSPARAVGGEEVLFCTIGNVGPNPIKVTMAIVDAGPVTAN